MKFWSEKQTGSQTDRQVKYIYRLLRNKYEYLGKINEETDTIEVGSMLGLGSCSEVRLEKPRREEIGSAERVSVSPVSPADWDIIKLNQNGKDSSENLPFL